MTVAEALRAAAAKLAAVSDTPRLDAELLMADALGTGRGAMLLGRMGDAEPAGFAERVDRRMRHEPVAYITGRQEFWSLDLIVSSAVLIPRADSETLITAAIEALRGSPPRRILDLGTGSGALLLAALTEWPEAHGLGVDASEGALAIARANAAALGIAPRAAMRRADWRVAGWARTLDGPYDLVLANPPYVEAGAALAPQVRDHEPPAALFAGEDGLDDYRRLLPALGQLLAPGGVAVFEIGASQRQAVTRLAEAAGLAAEGHRDLAGRDRAILLRRSAAA